MDLLSIAKAVFKKPEEQLSSEAKKKTELLPQIQLSPLPLSGSRDPLQLLNIDLELLRLQFIKEEWKMQETHHQTGLIEKVVTKQYICCDCELCLYQQSDIRLINTEEKQLRQWFTVKNISSFQQKLYRIQFDKNGISSCETGLCQSLLFCCRFMNHKQAHRSNLMLCLSYCLCFPWIVMYNCCKCSIDKCSLKQSRLNRIYKVYKTHQQFILKNQKQ